MVDYDKLTAQMLTVIGKHHDNELNNHIDRIVHGEHMVLGYLYFHENTVAGDLAQAMKASTAYIAKILRNMEEKGLICRSTDPNDRRRTIVTLTPSGQEQARKDISFLHSKIREMLVSLGDEDAAALVRICQKLTFHT